MNKKDTLYIGSLGEDLAAKFLEDKGYLVVGRNYREKWGEIDLIAEKGRVVHFVEVKAVENNGQFSMPEERVHKKKLKKLFRTIQTYLGTQTAGDKEWQLDVLAVFIDPLSKVARIRHTSNVILE